MFQKLLLGFIITCIGYINAMESLQSMIEPIVNNTELNKNTINNTELNENTAINTELNENTAINTELNENTAINTELNENNINEFGKQIEQLIDNYIIKASSFENNTNCITQDINTNTFPCSNNNIGLIQVDPLQIDNKLYKILIELIQNKKYNGMYDLYFTKNGTLYIEQRNNFKTYEPLFNKDNNELDIKIKCINYKQLAKDLLEISKLQTSDKYKYIIDNNDFSAIHKYLLQSKIPFRELIQRVCDHENNKDLKLNSSKLELLDLLNKFYKFQQLQSKKCLINEKLNYSDYFNNNYNKKMQSQCKILINIYLNINTIIVKSQQEIQDKMSRNFIDNFENII